MRTTLSIAALAALMLAPGPMLAQTASSPAATASAPRAGPPGPMHRGGRWGKDFTPGWAMMSPQERKEHQDKMLAMTNAAECRNYMEQHHTLMAERAKQKGATLPAKPRRDGCTGLQP
jgi:hypothetical protein